MIKALSVAAALALVAEAALPQAPRPAPAAPAARGAQDRPTALGTLGSSKEPIKIDADRLDVFDRDNRAVFSGNVVVVQGESTMRCSSLVVSYERRGDPGRPAVPGSDDSAIRQIDCAGPVTVVSRDQVATGDKAVFDRVANKVVMTGNVALSQCQNVTRGERLVYDLSTGVANVETAPGGRVRAMFVPGGGDDAAKQGCTPGALGAPAAAPAAPARPAAAPARPQPAEPRRSETRPRTQTN